MSKYHQRPAVDGSNPGYAKCHTEFDAARMELRLLKFIRDASNLGLERSNDVDGIVHYCRYGIYSNRVAVVLEQPVAIKVPFGACTSEVPAEVYALPFDSNSASWVIFVQPVKFPAGSKLKLLKLNR